jgi:hypothetical protein
VTNPFRGSERERWQRRVGAADGAAALAPHLLRLESAVRSTDYGAAYRYRGAAYKYCGAAILDTVALFIDTMALLIDTMALLPIGLS